MAVETERAEVDAEELTRAGGGDPMEDETAPDELAERDSSKGSLPWIGSLRNPHLVPMAVLNESGYFVPLWTAGDLLRGCKYFWRA